MVTKSNNSLYNEVVSENIGFIYQYAVNCGFDPIIFWNKFINSYVCKEIEMGNPKYLVGHSAIELFNFIINDSNNSDFIIPEPFYSRPRFYWAGWSIAKYQHYRGLSFYELNKIVSIEQILPLYDTLHEADITKFYMILDEIVFNHKKESNLKIIRTAAGLSQSELSKIERGEIYNPSNVFLYRLSKALDVEYNDLLRYRWDKYPERLMKAGIYYKK